MYYDYFCKMFVGIHSFNSSVYFSGYKICSHLHLLTHFFSMHFRTPVTVKQTSYRKSYIFRAASITLKLEQSLQVAPFSQKNFSEHLVVSCSYFFLITTSWEQILSLGNSYFFKENSSSQLLLRWSYVFSSYYSEHVLGSRHFF